MLPEQYLPTIVAALIGASVAAVFKAPGRVATLMRARADRAEAERAQHEAQTALINTLKRELFENGGRSLRDKVNEAAGDSAAALELGKEGIALAKEVRQVMFNHIEWHAQK